jgi:hypothetical protein
MSCLLNQKYNWGTELVDSSLLESLTLHYCGNVGTEVNFCTSIPPWHQPLLWYVEINCFSHHWMCCRSRDGILQYRGLLTDLSYSEFELHSTLKLLHWTVCWSSLSCCTMAFTVVMFWYFTYEPGWHRHNRIGKVRITTLRGVCCHGKAIALNIVWVGLYSCLSYQACKTCVLFYCHLWPVWLYLIFHVTSRWHNFQKNSYWP